MYDRSQRYVLKNLRSNKQLTNSMFSPCFDFEEKKWLFKSFKPNLLLHQRQISVKTNGDILRLVGILREHFLEESAPLRLLYFLNLLFRVNVRSNYFKNVPLREIYLGTLKKVGK